MCVFIDSQCDCFFARFGFTIFCPYFLSTPTAHILHRFFTFCERSALLFSTCSPPINPLHTHRSSHISFFACQVFYTEFVFHFKSCTNIFKLFLRHSFLVLVTFATIWPLLIQCEGRVIRREKPEHSQSLIINVIFPRAKTLGLLFLSAPPHSKSSF